MNFQCKEHPEYLELILSGRADASDWEAMQQAIYSHPTWEPGKHLLADFRQLDCTEVTPGDIFKTTFLTVKSTRLLGNGRLAALMGDDLAYGLARMFLGYAEEKMINTTKLFRDRTHAVAWLGENKTLKGASTA
jgi:hypothetical protein